MRTFRFIDNDYDSISTLGVAFAEHYKEAMDVITTKEFLKFCKQFKGIYKQVTDILYSTRYVQNVVTLVIYLFTNGHKFVVYGKTYVSFKEFSKDIDTPGFKLFLSEKGFSKTVVSASNNEKIKQDLITLEENYNDDFALKFIKEYYNYDSIENIETALSEIYNNRDEQFRRAHELFSSESTQMLLGHRYSLDAVLKLRNDATPVFNGLELIQAEMPEETIINLLQNGFYYFLVENIKQYKFKGKAKQIVKKIKSVKNELKKEKKPSVNFLCSKCRELYNLYILTVDYFNEGKIKVKESKFEFTAHYCGTLIPVAYVGTHSVKLGSSNETKAVVPEEKLKYDLRYFDKAVIKYKRFTSVSLFFMILFAAYCGVGFLLKELEVIDIAIISRNEGDLVPLFAFAGSLGAMLIFTIVVFIKAKIDEKRYNKLCKLAYYRIHKLILNDKENKELAKLSKIERNLVKKINRLYRLFAGLVLAGIGLATGIILVSLNNSFNLLDMTELLQMPYLMLVPAVVNFVFALFRRRKSGFSILLGFIIGALATVGCIFLAPML